MSIFFSTEAPYSTIKARINRARALDCLYDLDRATLGLPVSGRAGVQCSCLVSKHAAYDENGKTTFHYSIDTNVESWVKDLFALPGFKLFTSVDMSDFPWCNRHTEDFLAINEMTAEKAKGLISLPERCEHRAFDIAFVAYLQYTNTNLAVYTLEATIKAFHKWVVMTEEGKQAYDKSFKICQSKLV